MDYENENANLVKETLEQVRDDMLAQLEELKTFGTDFPLRMNDLKNKAMAIQYYLDQYEN